VHNVGSFVWSCLFLAVFEPTITGKELPQTHALHRASTGTATNQLNLQWNKNICEIILTFQLHYSEALSVKVTFDPVESFFDSRSVRYAILSATHPQLFWVIATFLSSNTRVCHPMLRLLVLKFAHPAPTSAQVKREWSCNFTSPYAIMKSTASFTLCLDLYGIPSCTERWHHSKLKHFLLSIKSTIFPGLVFFLVYSQKRKKTNIFVRCQKYCSPKTVMLQMVKQDQFLI